MDEQLSIDALRAEFTHRLQEVEAQLHRERARRHALEAQMSRLHCAGRSVLRPLVNRSLVVLLALMWIVSPGIAAANGLPNSWRPAPTMPNTAYELGAATGLDGLIYAIGGYNEGPLDAVRVYDSNTDDWQTVAPMPTARSMIAAAAGSDGKIYVFGGYDDITIHQTVEAYDPSTNTWTCSVGDFSHGCTSSTLAPMPTPRYGLAAVAATNGKIYVIGGTNVSTTFNVVEAYNPRTNTWTCSKGDTSCNASQRTLGNPLATGRVYLGAALGSTGKIYAIGGSSAVVTSSGSLLSSVEMYDPSSPRSGWTAAAPLGSARFGLAAAVGIDGRIYAIGGVGDDGILSLVEAYTPTNNAAGWSVVANLVTPRYDFGAATASDGRIYALDGLGSGGPVSSAEAYTSGPEAGFTGIGLVGVIGLQAGKIQPATTLHAGVYGAGATGVQGVGTTGVVGSGTTGGSFGGSKVPLHLVPGASTGHPIAGSFQKGDIYLDHAGTLFMCVVGGTPCGQWQQFTTTIAP